MIKAVIFDFDHTLYDREKTIVATAPELRRLLSDYVRPELSDEQFTKALLNAETSPEGYYFNGYQGVVDRLAEQNVFVTVPDCKTYTTAFYPTMSKNLAVFSDTYDTLTRIKEMGYKIALLTNGVTDMQLLKLSYTKIPELMDKIIISDSIGQQKPHPRPFVAMCKQLDIQCNEAAYVGDNLYCDICGARGVGMTPVWFPFVTNFDEEIARPELIIHSLSELPQILEQL